MAKNLLKDYTFDASARTITVPDNIATNRLLVITNVTDNIILYNFADSTKGVSNRTYVLNDNNGRTTFTLDYDTTSMSDDDDLQILIDDDDQKITFDDRFVDPVSKLRVSNPNTLIDTDFEYGPQPTKWETLELVNNIPVFFTRSGSFITAFQSILSENGTKIITVTTLEDHGLAVGDPIDVRDVADRDAQGSFVVESVETTTSFTYTARAVLKESVDITTAQTTINKGKFFSVSDVQLKSDTASLQCNSSTVTVSAGSDYIEVAGAGPYASGHNFSNGMPVLWLASLGISTVSTEGAIGGLTSNTIYYVKTINATAFELHSNYNLASIVDLGSTTSSSTSEYGSLAEIQGVTFSGSAPHDLIFRTLPSRPISNQQPIYTFNNTLANADGSYDVSAIIDDQSFIIENATSDTLANAVYSFTTSTAVVNATADSITVPGHELDQGQMISFEPNHASTSGFSIDSVAADCGKVFYAIPQSNNTFGVAATATDALSGIKLPLTYSASRAYNLVKYGTSGIVQGTGTINISNGSAQITGVGTSFETEFKAGDEFKVYVPPLTFNNDWTSYWTSPSSTLRQSSYVQLSNNSIYWPYYNYQTSYNRNGYIIEGRPFFFRQYSTRGAPRGASGNTMYYMIPYNEGRFPPVGGRPREFRVATSLENALANNYLSLTGYSTTYLAIFFMPFDTSTAATGANTNVIYRLNHGIADGATVTVDVNASPPYPLTDGDYTANVINEHIFQLLDGANTPLNFEHFRASTQPGTYLYYGTSTAATTSTASPTQFHYFRYIRPPSILNGTAASIVNNTILATEEPILPAGSSDATSAPFYLKTRLLPRSTAYAVHRSFDGGMEITTGNPIEGSQIIRQSRRYFRYQSGKGLQISKAVNFKPPIEVDDIAMCNTVAFTTSSANVANGTAVTSFSVESTTTFPGNGVINVVDSSNTDNVKATFTITSKTSNSFVVSANTWYEDVVEGDSVYVKDDEVENQKWINIQTKFAHGLLQGASVTIENSEISNTSANNFDGTFAVATVGDDYNFQVYYGDSYPDQAVCEGFPAMHANTWSGSAIRAGMFDSQNGMFFEFDGSTLYTVRRDSTTKLHGTVNATLRSNFVVGNSTKFTRQLSVGDFIVVRGQSYKVNKIVDDLNLEIQPEYRGESVNRAVATKTIDTKVPQLSWNVDTCDGNGPSGYTIDLSKIQMCYIDYSWYGAGAVRFGFKDQNGKVIYVHTFRHNNQKNIAYLRSGNLPARYEVNNTSSSNYTPLLAHWGTSVIMDGEFEDDNAYFFTAFSDELTETGGSISTANQDIPILSVRLAPSVDSGSAGTFGARDIINRMQLQMARIDVATTDTLLVKLYLNPELSTGTSGFINNTLPSLTQYLTHSVDATNLDSISGGDLVYQFIAQGTTTSRFTGLRPTTTSIDLGQIVQLGNSIIGGKEVFPDGPDVLTVAVTPLENFDADSRASISLSWSESQA